MSKLTKNAVGRNIPNEIPGLGKLIPFQGASKYLAGINDLKLSPRQINSPSLPGRKKVLKSIREALELSGIKNGMTISFHHHFRQGDFVLTQVIDEIATMGIKDLTIASSSLTVAHDSITKHIENGTITTIHTTGIRSKFGKAISQGKLKVPAISRSHGARARAISSGQIKIDIAFIAASAADSEGNATGIIGNSLCGSLGYAMTDMLYAKQVIIITDKLFEQRLPVISIPQTCVDLVVRIENIGDSNKIATGSTRITKNPIDHIIAKNTARVLDSLNIIKDAYSFQTGAGGASLAVAKYVRDIMIEKKVKGSFICGGTTSYLVQMLEENLFDLMYDVQSFDVAVVESLLKNPNHIEISADYYANPFNKGALVNNLDVVILGALEIDTQFNVNALVGSDGIFMGAIGGHQDTAAGAKYTVLVAPTIRGRTPVIRDEVISITTPGESIDILVTERGIAINPMRKDIIDSLKNSNLPIKTIHELKERAENITGIPEKPRFTDEIAAIVEYRDGTILDIVYQLETI